MTSDERAFMSAIIADPTNDAPRLVFADWLEEQGDSNRAEFIRDTVWIHANHTDCPTRLADLGSGRPVPLRCGICEYCTRRRCAEKFNSKHHWIDAPAYAVFFEPTPLGGEIPATYGIALVIRRGFVAEVHCTLREWMGEPCPGCARIPARFKPLCKLCNGSGTIPGHGPAIVAAHPVERVVLSDLRPRESGVHWCWYMDDMPRQLFELVRLAVRDAASGAYSSLARLACISEQAARDALSAAAIAWAKQQQTPQFQSLCLQSPPPCPVCSVSMPREYGDGCCRSCHESGMVRGRRGWRQLGVYDG